MKRRLIPLLMLILSLAVAFTLFSCGDVDEPDGGDKKPHTHTASEWITDTEPTCKTEGTKHKECTECKEVLETDKIDKLEHKYSEEFKYNETHHYYECTCGEKKDEAKHVSSGCATAKENEVCTECGYVINPAIGILFKTLTVDGYYVSGKVSNNTEIYSFIHEISLVGGAKYIVSLNVTGTSEVPAKTVDLKIGDNTFYIIEMIDGEAAAVYTVVIRRLPLYSVTFKTDGGTSVITQMIEEGNLATEPTTTRAGYTFADWDYDFAKPVMSHTTVSASWTANTDTKYVVEYYLENVEKNDYVLDHTDTFYDTTDTTATAVIKNFDHFTHNKNMGKLSGNINGEGNLALQVYYTRDTYVITAASDNPKAGSVTGTGTYAYGAEAPLIAETNPGYTFIGWYADGSLASETENYTVTVTSDVAYTAMWSADTVKYTVEYYKEFWSDGRKTELLKSDELYEKTGETVTAPDFEVDGGVLNESISTLSGEVLWDGSLVLKVYYTVGELPYTFDGDYIYFGEYPQSIKADGVTITETRDSRGYYLGSDGFYYAKVVAAPRGSGYTFSTGASVTDGETYYFKVEPIRWRILSTDGETAFILCDSIIANKAYDAGYDNNYKNSDIRAWLNETFYETAFSELQREIILTTTVDNSVASTGDSSNPYVCEDTEDKIFLLSYKEVTNSAYGFASSGSTYDTARRMQTSDYSRATGVGMSTDSSYYGNGSWRLRSPDDIIGSYARAIRSGGNEDYDHSVYSSFGGVVPALQIRL